MEHNIVYYHKELQKNIHLVEADETNCEALDAVKKAFLALFDIIKMIMISRQERYYGIFLMHFDLKLDFTLYFDACVNIDFFPFRMIVNPLLIGLRPLREMIYIFCHEIEHIVLNHPVDGMKYNPQKDPGTGYKLNVAMDASINDRITKDNEKREYQIIAEPEDVITSKCLSENWGTYLKPLQAFNYYFKRFPKDRRGPGEKVVIILGDNGVKKDEIITKKKCKNVIHIPCWTEKDDPGECAGIIRRFVSDVCESMPASMRDKLPGSQKEALDKIITPSPITWEQLLKRYIGTVPDGHRKTRLRLNRRQPERYDLSGTISKRIVKIVVAVDTSASMSNEDLNYVMAEIFRIIGARKCEVTIVECDSEIQHIYKVRSAKKVSCDVHGRGGTSFIPVIEYVNADKYFRDAILIYFTDGMGDKSIPRPLTLRTIWVLNHADCELSLRKPYGEVLFIDR